MTWALDLVHGPRHLAEAYLALVPVLAMLQPWGGGGRGLRRSW